MIKLKEYIYYITVKAPSIFLGRLRGNLVRTHWGRGLNNFGDCLSPYILKHYGFTPVYSQVKDSDIIMAGTILQWIPKDFSGIIIGSGADDIRLEFPNAKILALRGKLTKENLSTDNQNLILGDPGLIMNYVFPKNVHKKYELGIVPHFVDKNCEIVKKWETKFGNKCKVINVLQSARIVIKEIKACRNIISSSLHGLIIADAFNIPNLRFVNRTTMPSDFYDYKFKDYYSSLESELITLEATGDESFENLLAQMELHTEQVESIQAQLNQLYLSLPIHFMR